MSDAILIRNGYVIDPEEATIQKRDIGILNGRLISPCSLRDWEDDVEIIDAEGAFVAPGFIDIHTHVFNEYTSLGLEADRIGVNQGVTTIVDAGSAGLNHYEFFKQGVIDKSKTEVLAFLNISVKGLCEGGMELSDPDDYIPIKKAKEIIDREPSIVGFKARMSGSVVQQNGVKPLQHAREIADELSLPIMVHIGNPPPLLQDIFPLLKEGDIVTHAFHGKPSNQIITSDQTLIPGALECLNRGILFDVGHGSASFSFNTLAAYKKKYDYPFSISSDLHSRNYEAPVGSLTQTMSKIRGMGYSLLEVIQAVTSKPAKTLNLTEQGTLANGTRADLTIFYEKEKRMELVDSEGDSLWVDCMIEPYITIREGKKVVNSNVGT